MWNVDTKGSFTLSSFDPFECTDEENVIQFRKHNEAKQRIVTLIGEHGFRIPANIVSLGRVRAERLPDSGNFS